MQDAAVPFLRKQESRGLVPPKSPLYVVPAKAGIRLFFSGFLLAQE
jgi:hypothetical protein